MPTQLDTLIKKRRNTTKSTIRHKNWRLERKYGITLSQYAFMLREQRGACAICKYRMVKVCVDHSHVTHKVRGLLCAKCNWGLGQFDDSPERLENAAKYIRENS